MRLLSPKRPGRSFVELLILAVVIAACVALVFVALHEFGIVIPAWTITVLWIVVVAVVVIAAIKFVASL